MIVHLSEVSGNIIREVWKSEDIGSKEKDKNQGPVTIADLRVQKTIETNLREIYPSLVIHGEEDHASYDQYDTAI